MGRGKKSLKGTERKQTERQEQNLKKKSLMGMKEGQSSKKKMVKNTEYKIEVKTDKNMKVSDGFSKNVPE